MSRSHRAGGPEYNPNTGMRVNQEHTSMPAERAQQHQPVEYPEEGVNFPYRGVEQHGVAFTDTIPDELEGAPSREDLTLVLPPHYAPKPHQPAPVPVEIVKAGAVERRAWQTDQFTVSDGSANGALMILGRQDNREYVTIHNMDQTHTVWIGPSPSVTVDTGYPLPSGVTSNRIYTTEAIYAVASSGNTAQIAVIWEYSVKV